MTEGPILYKHRVVYADCTLGNHVYYSRYLDILEAARGEFFRAAGVTLNEWQTRGFMFPVVQVQLRYKALARYDDLLQAEVWVTLHVCINLEEKLKRLPDELAAALKPHLRPATAA